MPDALQHIPDSEEAEGPLVTPPQRPLWTARSVLFGCVVVIAVVEILAHFVVQERVPSEDAFRDAAAYLRESAAASDAIVIAPEWYSPVARVHLGDMMTEQRAAFSDLNGFTGVYELSARGRRSAAVRGLQPDRTQRFGPLTLRHYDLGPSPLLYDLTDHIESARVALVRGAGAAATQSECPWRHGALGRGGLGAGPLMPAGRFECDPTHPWVFVGRTINEDLDLHPRRCVWQHPPEAGARVVTTYTDVPLGARLVLYAGLYYEHERMREHPPFELRVRVDGREVAQMRHRDGDGWKRIEADMGAGAPERRGQVEIEVSAENPHLRSVCWSAQILSGARRASEGESRE